MGKAREGEFQMLEVLAWRGRIYFPTPRIWSGFMTCFDQKDSVEMNLWKLPPFCSWEPTIANIWTHPAGPAVWWETHGPVAFTALTKSLPSSKQIDDIIQIIQILVNPTFECDTRKKTQQKMIWVQIASPQNYESSKWLFLATNFWGGLLHSKS